jgi:hypothetical protein
MNVFSNFTVPSEHGRYSKYRYSSTSLQKFVSLTTQIHNIFLEFVACLGEACFGMAK